MVSDEKEGVGTLGDAFDHRERFEASGNHAHAIVELIDEKVSHVRVAVVDAHVRRAGIECSTRGGVGFVRHPSSHALEVRPSSARLVDMNDAGTAFHVHRDQDLHRRSSSHATFAFLLSERKD